MNFISHHLRAWLLLALNTIASSALIGETSAATIEVPYKVLEMTQSLGTGSIDYVNADNDDRRLYIPRGEQVLVFDLDTLKSVGAIPNAKARGVAVDPESHHGFSSSSPVVMWDTKSLEIIKKIEVKGRPDAILFEPSTKRIFVFSHNQPNATVMDAKEGSVVGTIDLGGAPEQAVSDGHGRLFVDLEDKDKIAVVDVSTLKVTAHFDLAGKGGGPAGLALDTKNHILFAFCRDPQTCVVLSADDGKIITTLPIGRGTDGGLFNPDSMEAFSSQGDGTLTIIKELSPTHFEVQQTLTTKPRAKTCTLDTKKNQIVLVTTEPGPTTVSSGGPETAAPKIGSAPTVPPGPVARKGNSPSFLDIIVVGR